jgi:hypothetical protein
MQRIGLVALGLASMATAQMPVDDYGNPKFGEQTFDPSDFPVSESLTRVLEP